MEPNGTTAQTSVIQGEVDTSPPPAPPDTPTPPEARQEPKSAELEALRAQVATAAAERDAALAQAATAAQDAQDRLAAAEAQLAETHRRALLAEHRGSVIDELVTGSTPADLDASIEVAKAAYTRVADLVRAERPALTLVPAGASPRAEPDAESLSPIQKLTMALGRNGQA